MLKTVTFGLTLVLLAIALLTLADENCVDEEDRQFLVDNRTMYNWYAAQQFCASEGMTLVSINSGIKNSRILHYLTAANYLEVVGIHPHFWTSGSRLANNATWLWFSNGLPTYYTNWAKGQPDNNLGRERCIVYLRSGVWYDVNCMEEKFPICESRWASNFLRGL